VGGESGDSKLDRHYLPTKALLKNLNSPLTSLASLGRDNIKMNPQVWGLYSSHSLAMKIIRVLKPIYLYHRKKDTCR